MCGDEGAALRVGEGAAGRRVGERVGVEEEALPAEREVVDGAEQDAVVEDARAEADDRVARAERIVGEREARGEVVTVADDCLVLVAQPEGEDEVGARAPLLLRK